MRISIPAAEASRWVLVAEPAGPPVTVLPVRHPKASRYWIWMLASVPPIGTCHRGL